MQLQFENRVRLRGSERLLGIVLGRPAGGVDFDFLATEVCDQAVASLATVGAGANDDDDVVEMIERGQVAFENVLALFGLGQEVGGPATNYVHAVINKMSDGLDETQLLGLSVDHGEQDHAEAFLHLRVLEKLIEHELRLAATLELDHDAHAVAVALVANVGDVFDVLIVDQFGDTLDQPRLVYLIGNLGDDDGLTVFVDVLDSCSGAHHEAAAAVSVCFEDSALAVNDAGSGEVGALHELQQVGELCSGVIDKRNRGIDDLRKIVRRDIGRHADGNAIRAVNQQIRNARRQDGRFDVRVIVGRNEIHRVLVDVGVQIFRDPREAALGISHGRGRVSVHGTEISLTIH